MDIIMTFPEKRKLFEETNHPTESALLTFHGIDGFDVYNCSIPFEWQGETYLYGRVERRTEWARSWSRLFRRTGQDEYTLVENSMIYRMEDPFVSVVHGELVLGGTAVRNRCGTYCNLWDDFYRGTDLENLFYFTCGPDMMKDVRLVELSDGIGVFSRPRGPEVEAKYGSGSVVGYTEISSLDELSPEIIEAAPPIDGLFQAGEWGGCNQCYLLDSGYIGIIGHKSYQDKHPDGGDLAVYTNISWVYDPKAGKVLDEKILATRRSYPDAPAKLPNLRDCTFTSGIVMRPDGKADLYGGLGDTCEGRICIDYPFEGFGKISK